MLNSYFLNSFNVQNKYQPNRLTHTPTYVAYHLYLRILVQDIVVIKQTCKNTAPCGCFTRHYIMTKLKYTHINIMTIPLNAKVMNRNTLISASVLCCCSSLFVRLCYMWPLFCHYLFLISHHFSASGGLYFVIVPFPVYVYLRITLQEAVISKQTCKILYLANV